MCTIILSLEKEWHNSVDSSVKKRKWETLGKVSCVCFPFDRFFFFFLDGLDERRGCVQWFFLSQTCSRHGMSRHSRLHHHTSMSLSCSQQVGDQGDLDSRSLQPVPSGSCPLSPTATCGHCHWDWAVPQALASSLQKSPHSESHELSTAKAWWRCLTLSLAIGQRPLASAHSNTLPRPRDA